MLVYQLDTWYCNLGDNVGVKKTTYPTGVWGPIICAPWNLDDTIGTMGGGCWCLNIAAFPLGVDDFFFVGVLTYTPEILNIDTQNDGF